MKYSLAIFDMDGTILDTLEDLCDSVNHILTLHNMPTRSLDEVRSFVGNGIRLLVERAVADGTDKDILEVIFAEFAEYYDSHCAIKTRAYDGIIDLLKQLKKSGIKTAVVSNKPDSAVQALCEEHFPGLFDAAAGVKPNVRTKPAPDMVNGVLDALSIDREDAVYIGDSEVDIATAKNSSLPCISVNWGFRDEEFLRKNGSEIIVSKPEECLRYI